MRGGGSLQCKAIREGGECDAPLSANRNGEDMPRCRRPGDGGGGLTREPGDGEGFVRAGGEGHAGGLRG